MLEKYSLDKKLKAIDFERLKPMARNEKEKTATA